VVALETEYVSEIVRKSWSGDFADAKQMKMEVVAFLEGLGWTIEENHDLRELNTANLSFD
jgi:hypothetical protein